MNTTLRRARLAALAVAVPLAGAVSACTDLDENPTSTIAPNNFYQTEQEVRGALAGVYATQRDVADNYWYISQVSTDETVVPVRGSDWFDNGKWLELHRQTWAPGSAAGGDNINGAWEQLFRGVARANVVLNALQPNSVPNQATYEAELRALRAWYYLLLNDLFGGVPIVTEVGLAERERNTRDSVFKFVEAELLAARPALPVKWDAANYGRVTRGAVDAILASLYLNARVFTGEVTANGLTPGAARWQDAINRADSVLNSSAGYTLAPDWRSNFTPTNESSPEIIFAARFTAQDGLGLTFINRAVHYNHYRSPGGWNGFSILADTYNSFDAADQRRQIFLVGPQVSLETGVPINDRAGNRLVLVPDINLTQATENQGIRVVKFPFDPSHVAQHMGNDYPLFRLAEIYLIKAEALNELGRTAEAIPLVNAVRARVFNPPNPLAAAGWTQATFRNQILKERLYELTNEGKRRQDMIRMGVFTSPFQYKEQREPYRILFPIPTRQLQTNPLLQQNAGY